MFLCFWGRKGGATPPTCTMHATHHTTVTAAKPEQTSTDPRPHSFYSSRTACCGWAMHGRWQHAVVLPRSGIGHPLLLVMISIYSQVVRTTITATLMCCDHRHRCASIEVHLQDSIPIPSASCVIVATATASPPPLSSQQQHHQQLQSRQQHREAFSGRPDNHGIGRGQHVRNDGHFPPPPEKVRHHDACSITMVSCDFPSNSEGRWRCSRPPANGRARKRSLRVYNTSNMIY